MSGHSKWKTIKRQKGAADQKRGVAFTKLAIAITLAVKQGGGIENAIEKARSANMPKENIERAIEKGMGKGGGDDLQEVVYEGFGPGGSVIIVEAVTDNKMRTTSEIKNVFDKNGGTFGQPGSVAYQFAQKGSIIIILNGRSIDEVFMIAADAGAQDLEDDGDIITIYTKPEELSKIKDALSKNNIAIKEAEIIRKPILVTTIEDAQTAEKIMTFIEKLEDHDDVQKVYTNVTFPDSLIDSLSIQT